MAVLIGRGTLFEETGLAVICLRHGESARLRRIRQAQYRIVGRGRIQAEPGGNGSRKPRLSTFEEQSARGHLETVPEIRPRQSQRKGRRIIALLLGNGIRAVSTRIGRHHGIRQVGEHLAGLQKSGVDGGDDILARRRTANFDTLTLLSQRVVIGDRSDIVLRRNGGMCSRIAFPHRHVVVGKNTGRPCVAHTESAERKVAGGIHIPVRLRLSSYHTGFNSVRRRCSNGFRYVFGIR